MATLNKIVVIGNLGGDPEMRYTANGNPMTTFNLATNRVFTTPEGEKQKETEWFSVVAWNKLAETCNQFLAKGRRAYVEGRLRSRTWEGSDGKSRFRNEIIANTVIFLDRPTSGGALPEEGEVEAETPTEANDLPF